MQALITSIFAFVSFQEKSIRACGSLEMAPSLAPPPIDAVFLRLQCLLTAGLSVYPTSGC